MIQVNPGNIMLSEKSETKAQTLPELTSKFTAGCRMGVTSGRRHERYSVSVWDDEKFWS
jgi:4-hydroxy-3-methylbut-2-en-1-yl diphosphate synthase IspG/GcpE